MGGPLCAVGLQFGLQSADGEQPPVLRQDLSFLSDPGMTSPLGSYGKQARDTSWALSKRNVKRCAHVLDRAPRPLLRSALHLMLRFRRPETELGPDRLYAYLDALWQRRAVPGDVLEIGCFRGGTTRIAYRFLRSIQSPKRYVAMDTFHGFVSGQFEQDRRHGTPDRLSTGFSINGLEAVRRSLKADGCDGVELVKGDIATVADSALPTTVAVCLIDVDLEIPTYAGLSRVIGRLASGGVALVDDCDPANDFAGALVGYRRFVSEQSLPEEYFMGMGLVRA